MVLLIRILSWIFYIFVFPKFFLSPHKNRAFSPILELLMTFDPVEKLDYCFGTGLQSIPGTVHPERLTAGTYKSPIWKGKWMKWSSNPPWGHVPAVNLQGVYDYYFNGPPWLPSFGALKSSPKGWLHEIAEFSQGAGMDGKVGPWILTDLVHPGPPEKLAFLSFREWDPKDSAEMRPQRIQT